MAWVDYYDMLNAIEKYYGSTSDVYGEVLKHGPLAENFPEIAKQAGIDVVTNAKGDVLSYSVKQSVTNDLSQGWEIANAANSNIQTGTSKNVFQIQKVSGTQVVEEAGRKIVKESPITKYTNGVKGILNTPVRGTVAPAIAAVAAGVRLGKAIDSSIYKIGDAMGLNPPEELNPETWASLVSEIPDSGLSGAYKWGFNTIFGFDPDTKNGQMYLDENALAYMAQYLNNTGVIGKTEETTTQQTVNNVTVPAGIWKVVGTTHLITLNNGASTSTVDGQIGTFKGWPARTTVVFNNDSTELYGTIVYQYDNTPLTIISTKDNNTSAFNWLAINPLDDTDYQLGPVSGGGENKTITINGKTARYTMVQPSGLSNEIVPIKNSPKISDGYLSWNALVEMCSAIAWSLIYGQFETNSENIDGVTNITGGSVPNTENVKSIDEMLALLKATYPELWKNRVEQEVAQPDGTTKVITYVPISIPTGGAGLNPDSTGNTQNGTEITEGTSTDTQLNTIIQYITRLDSLNKGMQNTDTPVTTPPLNPPATGEGGTPVVPPVTGKASALYTIYNPTLEQINSLGAWLWSSNFIDQLLKLFSSPMDAIIGLHKVYATPATGASQNIKVGYLDSGVPSKIVTEQYTTIDCGTINCYEYFGNVLDYNPYTNLRLYLPFIGIIELSNSDVMRSNINVVYHVDVLTGACLAEVKISRDGGGGTLYQYAGNACTTLPISSGSYMGVISSVSSVATRALAGFASGGALGAVASGATGILNAQGTNVVHSGGFSGNAGAMGCKKPYLIIERPQTETANNTAKLIGYGSNLYTELRACKGFTTVKAVHVDTVTTATENEKNLIEQALKQGVIIK